MSASEYELDIQLGHGAFGYVYRARKNKEGPYFAIKIVDFEQTDDIRRLFNEVLILSKLRSNYLNKYYESFQVGSTLWIVLEYCGGGLCLDLIKVMGRLPEEIASYIIKNVLLGTMYLHRQRLIHRDIKLANIFITEGGYIKLGDFGVSSEVVHTLQLRHTMVGLGHWMAPEVITSSGYDRKADIWSIGITAYELLFGRSPTQKLSIEEAFRNIPFSCPPRLPNNYSQNAQSFVERILVKNPRYRPEAVHLLDHNFITTCMADHTNMEKLLFKKTQVYEKRGLAPKVIKNRSQMLISEPISWEFPEDTMKGQSENQEKKTADLHNKENEYLDIVLESCARVFKRARCDRTRQFIDQLCHMLKDGEEKNKGLCQALLDDLKVVYSERFSLS